MSGRDGGFLMGGTAWYRKHFTLGKESAGKQTYITFDGVYMNADVWINGHHLGNHPNGYTSFQYYLTPHLLPPGRDNVIAVQVKNEGVTSRWYSGSGIDRHVWLTTVNPLHIDLWGVYHLPIGYGIRWQRWRSKQPFPHRQAMPHLRY